MTFDPRKQHRRSIRLRDDDYSRPGAYFITLVTHQRGCLFGRIEDGEMYLSPMGQIADEHWRLIPEHFPHAGLGACVVMPNHVHGIIVIRGDGMAMDSSPSVGAIVGSYKMSVTRRIQRELGPADDGTVGRYWQRNYYEHITRDEGNTTESIHILKPT